jgi:hypothetical protein
MCHFPSDNAAALSNKNTDDWKEVFTLYNLQILFPQVVGYDTATRCSKFHVSS